MQWTGFDNPAVANRRVLISPPPHAYWIWGWWLIAYFFCPALYVSKKLCYNFALSFIIGKFQSPRSTPRSTFNSNYSMCNGQGLSNPAVANRRVLISPPPHAYWIWGWWLIAYFFCPALYVSKKLCYNFAPSIIIAKFQYCHFLLANSNLRHTAFFFLLQNRLPKANRPVVQAF